MKTNFDKAKEMWTIEDIGKGGICNVIRTMRHERSCSFRTCKECIEWLKQEYKEPILDDVEKEYLSAVIKPFKDKIISVKKIAHSMERDYITLDIKNDGPMDFPCFKPNTMYKGMKERKGYTLKDLGLE